jgi:capsanthin/capsorubin synthase
MGTAYDAVVAGAGPAGLAIAKALVEQGLRVACVDPEPERRWTNNTSTWADEIVPLGLDTYCDRIWPKAEVIFGERSRQVFERGYTHFDNDLLKQALIPSSLEMVEGRAVGVEHDLQGSTVTLESGEKLRATLVFDATGHDHALLPSTHSADSFQNVYGILARVDRHPFDLDRMLLMDFRHAFLGNRKSPPTFLYAMPWDSDYAFFEETSLADSPGVPFEVLQGRLYLRLASLGIKVCDVESVEVGALPLNGPMPDPSSRVIGFGAAGGFVQASTGWSVGHSLRLAGPVSQLVAAGLSESLPPEETARRVRKLVWTPALLRMRRFHLRGGEFFGHIGIGTLSVFMKVFFNAPGDIWKVYLSNDCTILGIDRALARGIAERITGAKG